jgi:hypothetical protein
MPLLMICSVRGRPGVTTTALALAVCAPVEVHPVLVECDPAGGDLMRRHHLAARPSLVDLAAASRTTGSSATGFGAAGPGALPEPADPFKATSQRISLRDWTVDVVVAPAGGAQTRAALPELSRSGQAALNPPNRLVIADCGRLDLGSPCRALLELADVVMVLARPRADELAHLRERLGDLVDHAAGRLVVVTAQGGSYGVAEVSEVLTGVVVDELARDANALYVAGPLPADRRAAAVLGGDLLPGRRWQRLPLLGAAGRLLGEVAPRLATAPARAEAPR